MLILLRHGQTPANAGGLLLGRADPPLTELGCRQAAAAAMALAGDVHRVVSSPLRRAQQTAEALGLPVDIDEEWIEVDYGEYEGLPYRDVPAELWQQWRTEPGFAPPGGESMAAVGARVRAACAALQEEAAERNVVVVSHVSPIKAAVAWSLGVGDDVPWRMFLDVAAICRVGIGPNGPTLRSYNDTAHLAGVS
ncbi:MAG: histidine phosphatase family protein [Actinobacteria bacterium]|nr:histidine phosphatase family protein [Actinomycetota bacterium]